MGFFVHFPWNSFTTLNIFVSSSPRFAPWWFHLQNFIFNFCFQVVYSDQFLQRQALINFFMTGVIHGFSWADIHTFAMVSQYHKPLGRERNILRYCRLPRNSSGICYFENDQCENCKSHNSFWRKITWKRPRHSQRLKLDTVMVSGGKGRSDSDISKSYLEIFWKSNLDLVKKWVSSSRRFDRCRCFFQATFSWKYVESKLLKVFR